MYSVEEVKQYVKESHFQRGAIFNPIRFEREFLTFLTTRKMVTKFLRTGVVNDKLLVNNVILLLNSFGIPLTNRAVRLICNDNQYAVLKAILIFLSCFREVEGPDVEPNRVMVDILRDVERRYHLEHCR